MPDLTPPGTAAVRLARRVVELKAERDRAIKWAVTLEGQLARVEALAEEWEQVRGLSFDPADCAEDLRNALEADQ